MRIFFLLLLQTLVRLNVSVLSSEHLAVSFQQRRTSSAQTSKGWTNTHTHTPICTNTTRINIHCVQIHRGDSDAYAMQSRTACTVHRRDHDAAKTIKRRHFPLIISTPVFNSRAALGNKCGRQIFREKPGWTKSAPPNKNKHSSPHQTLADCFNVFSGSGLDHQGPNQMDTHDIHQVSRHFLYICHLLSCLRDCLLN